MCDTEFLWSDVPVLGSFMQTVLTAGGIRENGYVDLSDHARQTETFQL